MASTDKTLRRKGQWPAWLDDVLAYEPIRELGPEWQASVADSIVRVLDLRAGLADFPKCEKCGSLKTLHCTILGCGLPRRYRFRLSAWVAGWLP